jgi:hypothetical protein
VSLLLKTTAKQIWIADFLQIRTAFVKAGELKFTQSNTQHPGIFTELWCRLPLNFSAGKIDCVY